MRIYISRFSFCDHHYNHRIIFSFSLSLSLLGPTYSTYMIFVSYY